VCVSSSRHATLCRVADRRATVGGWTGTSFLEVDVGRIHSWDGPARVLYLGSSNVAQCADMVLFRADYMQGTRQSFRTKEDAIAFAERQGRLSIALTSTSPIYISDSCSPFICRLGLLRVSHASMYAPLMHLLTHPSTDKLQLSRRSRRRTMRRTMCTSLTHFVSPGRSSWGASACIPLFRMHIYIIPFRTFIF
jgi:hypothetical protein